MIEWFRDSVVECLHDSQEVVGSNPTGTTALWRSGSATLLHGEGRRFESDRGYNFTDPNKKGKPYQLGMLG